MGMAGYIVRFVFYVNRVFMRRLKYFKRLTADVSASRRKN